uniref:chitinase n=1 Tax=Oryza rufipogon TaxID=4529 RepID=A0A0E0R1Z8_ORYRU
MTTTTTRFVQLAACAAASLLAVAASGAAAQGVGSVITQAVFNSMLPNRDNSQCPARGFYTYDAFIAAANSFPAFGTSGGSAELIRRELAAFFGQTSHETTGTLLITATELPSSRERAGAGPGGQPRPGVHRRRGLLQDGHLVLDDGAGEQAYNKPSSHDVILGRWTPSAADTAAGRVPGYGVITNIINGGIECGVGQNDANVDRIGYYKRYCDMLGAGYGSNLDCYNQRNFAS